MAQDDPPSEEDKNTEWAELRTDLAEDRTIMAMERTFAGWLRTALASIGIGLGFKALFVALEPPWLPKAIASGFIIAGAWLALVAERRTRKTLRKLHPHRLASASPPNFRLMAFALAVGSALLVIGLWTVKEGRIGG